MCPHASETCEGMWYFPSKIQFFKATTVFALKGMVPVIIKYNRTPNAQVSTLLPM